MRFRFLICAAVCLLWWLGLVVMFEPLTGRAALARHGADAAIDAPPPSNYDFYRANEDVQRDSVLRQRRLVASGYVERAEGRLDLFQSLATWPPAVALLITAVIGWIPESPAPRPPPSAGPTPRWSGGRRTR